MVATLTTKPFMGLDNPSGGAMLHSMESTQEVDNRRVQNEASILNFTMRARSARAHEYGVNPNSRRLLRLREVMHIAGVGKTTLYGMMKDGEFPQSVKISGRAVGWPSDQVAAWVEARIAAGRVNHSRQHWQLAA